MYVPKFKILSKPHPKWFSSTVRHQLKCTHTLLRTFRKQPTISNHLKLLAKEKDLQNTILISKEQYVDSITKEFGQNQRKLYCHLQSITSSKNQPDFFTVNNLPVYDAQQIANTFNQFFNSTFQLQVTLYCWICPTFQPLLLK